MMVRQARLLIKPLESDRCARQTVASGGRVLEKQKEKLENAPRRAPSR